MASSDAAQVLAGLKRLIDHAPQDKAIRNELYRTLKKLSDVIEEPHDTIYRITFSVSNSTKKKEESVELTIYVPLAFELNACSSRKQPRSLWDPRQRRRPFHYLKLSSDNRL
jgi:hypothetical protein